jgi:acetoin utilization protein AcuC
MANEGGPTGERGRKGGGASADGSSAADDGPLLVFGPRSATYDFGPSHPLTPRRFGPGIDLLRAVGAEPGLAPEPATDDELLACHAAEYIAAVRRLGDEPGGRPERGIGPGDTPSFAGMHEAGAMVAGGSLRAVEEILAGRIEHAYHPGGGLHHAMAGRASGFCIYDDPALAIARARRDGLRVLYVDLDVHHGDGVQAIHWADLGVLTISFHESGRTLFPGTGFPDELGEGAAAGTSVNVPLEAFTGESAWLAAVEGVLPGLAAAFGPDLIVSQHGADSHAWDPLANLRVTTTAMGRAARLIDSLAHRWSGGRWLATGGGGYDVYSAVPRAWALTWLAGTHRDAPEAIPASWRERWAAEAEAYGTPLPTTFDDPPNAGVPHDGSQQDAEARSRGVAAVVRSMVVPRLLREAEARRWWSLMPGTTNMRPDPAERAHWVEERPIRYRPAVIASVPAHTLDRLDLAPRVVPPLDPDAGLALLRAAVVSPGVRLTVAVDETTIVGVVLSALAADEPARRDVIAICVAPAARRDGLAARMLEEHLATLRPGDEVVEARLSVGERDPVDPLPAELRRSIAASLLEGAGFVAGPPDRVLERLDPTHLVYRRGDLGLAR